MKRFARPIVLFVCSFAVGAYITPVFINDKEPVSAPTQKPIQHHRNKYGETIKRIV